MMAVDEELPWTTSRCNRLLRPLSSKLAKLRKELERPRSAGTEPRNVSSAFATKSSPQKTTNFTRPAYKPRGFEKARDPDWKPGAKPGGSKKTYSGRGAKRLGLQRNALDVTKICRPGEIAFTPLIARTAGHFQSSPQLQHSPLKKFAKNRGPLLANIDTDLTRTLSIDLQKLLQGLLEAYANLLQATTAGDEKRWNGTRSLFGACLRHLPAYIELEEHFAELDRLEEDDDEDRDVTNEIYEHLETQFEQRAGHGWRPFKQVVRAHGTSLLCNAVADRVLDLRSLAILVTHCLNASAWDEAEKLLLAYAPLLEPVSIPTSITADLFDRQRSPYLHMVNGFVVRTGRHRLMFDLLEHMVAFELLPLEWLATIQMSSIWDRLVRTISDNNYRTLSHAVRFMETITLASIGLADERLLQDEISGALARRFVPSSKEDLRQALNTTFSSLLTVLCSIALVNNNREDTAGKHIARRITRVLDATVIAISRCNDIQTELRLLRADAEDMQVFAQRALWAGFASVVVRLDGCSPDNTMLTLDATSLIRCITRVATQYSSSSINFASILASLPSLISSTARGTGRIWKDDGFDQLQRLVTPLMTLSGCRLPHKLWTLKRLALESAMEFAHNTGGIQHLAYAREIENKMRSQGQLVITQSPEKNDSPSKSGGFRWEEGIGEWVVCTPFMKQNVKRQVRKPVRALDLLPTPIQSEDDRSDCAEEQELPGSDNDGSVLSDYEDDGGQIPHSSPIKKKPRTSTSSLGKRTRASSPMVVVPAKRVHLAASEAPVIFYSSLPEEKEQQDQDRSLRPRRSRTTIQELTSNLRKQRSRTSLESGLRNIQRATYAEPTFDDSDDKHAGSSEEDAIEDDIEDDDDSSAPSPPTSLDSQLDITQPDSSPQKRPRRRATQKENDDADERDELGRTPAQSRTKQRRASSRAAAKGRREWWKVGGGIICDSDDEASDDELSFH